MQVRSLELGDHDQWLALFQAYVEFYEADLDADVCEHLWARLMSVAPNTHSGICAVDENGTLIGMAHILFHESTWNKQPYCYLEDLFVAADVRGGGVGRALIEAVYTQADKENAARVYWVTQEENETARKLYDKVACRAPFVQYRR